MLNQRGPHYTTQCPLPGLSWGRSLHSVTDIASSPDLGPRITLGGAEYFLKSDDDGCEEIFPDILRLHHSSDWLLVSQMRAYYIVIV